MCLGVTSASAQADTGSISPGILKRLAEVADGHRTGRPIFVVLSRTFPHPVIAIVDTRERARVVAAANSDFGVFGPFVAAAEADFFVAFCVHDSRTTYMHPDWPPLTRWVDSISPTQRPASMPRTWRPSPMCPPERARVFRNGDIDSLSMTFHLRNGTRVTLPVPRNADALFFTLPAMDKFVFPYYVKVLGVDTVAAMRKDFIARLRR